MIVYKATTKTKTKTKNRKTEKTEKTENCKKLVAKSFVLVKWFIYKFTKLKSRRNEKLA